MHTRLECTRGANKFYELALIEGTNRFTVKGYYGAIGQAPKEAMIYDGDDRQEAVEALNKKKIEKLKKGYDEVSNSEGAVAAPKVQTTSDIPASDVPVIWPMAAVGAKDEREIEALLNNDKYVAQEKLDGMRAIIHITKTGLRIFSRSAGVADPTKPLEKTQSLPHLAELQFPNLAGTILDAEILEKGRTAAETSGDVHSKNGTSKVTIHVFDVIYLCGDGITAMTPAAPLARRLDALEAIAPRFAGQYIEFPTYARTTQAKKELYKEVTEAGGEGIMLKLLTGVYMQGARPAGNWIKVKKQATFDCVVMGFTEGEGKFNTQIGAIVFGQLINGTLKEIGKASGMTDAQRQHMSENKAEYIGRVIEIKGQERLKSGSIRHPQFVRLRTDKRPEECIYNPNEQ